MPFTGGIICISNLALKGHNKEILDAMNDRIYVISYEPTDDQIVALLKHIASEGVDGIPPAKCLMVCNYLVNECKNRSIRPSVRLFVDKAIRDYKLDQKGRTETHWKDLIVSNLEQQLTELQHPTSDLSKAEQIEAERRMVLRIWHAFATRAERIKQWRAQTNKSEPTFYRRAKELKRTGELPMDDVA